MPASCQTDPDDRLFAHLEDDGEAIPLSDDTGPRIKAHVGVDVLDPPEEFRLPPGESGSVPTPAAA